MGPRNQSLHGSRSRSTGKVRNKGCFAFFLLCPKRPGKIFGDLCGTFTFFSFVAPFFLQVVEPWWLRFSQPSANQFPPPDLPQPWSLEPHRRARPRRGSGPLRGHWDTSGVRSPSSFHCSESARAPGHKPKHVDYIQLNCKGQEFQLLLGFNPTTISRRKGSRTPRLPQDSSGLFDCTVLVHDWMKDFSNQWRGGLFL